MPAQLGMFADEAPTPIARVDIIWHVMVPWLGQFTNDSNARRIAGRIVKQAGREAAIVAFDKLTQVHPPPADPVSYLVKLTTQHGAPQHNGKPAPISAVERARNAIKQRRSNG